MAADPPLDFRSDTVTQPSPGMRRAMAEAIVGDDVWGEDPTTNRLQETVADLLGTEAALFVPTGCMANQIAIRAHCQPGDEALVGDGAHSYLYETGAAGALAGVQLTQLAGDGRFSADLVRSQCKPFDHHSPTTKLVMVENTHNVGGGVVWSAAALSEVCQVSGELGLARHLDGARLWNAARFGKTTERELAKGFDTVSVCLSKGLGAPVGSLVAGSREFVKRAHRIRKMYGGGMRQVGILAAAGLYALEHNRERLDEDHANASALAHAVAEVPGLAVDLASVQTNIVMVAVVDPDLGGAASVVARAKQLGLLASILRGRIRLTTHMDVDRSACVRAADLLARAASRPS